MLHMKMTLGLVICLQMAAPGWAAQVEFNGQRYSVEKAVENGVEVVRYSDGERRYTPDELRQLVATQPPQILTAAAVQACNAAGDGPVELIVMLRPQPAGPVSRVVWAESQPELDALTAEIRAITRKTLPQVALPPLAERAILPLPLSVADYQVRRALAEQRDELMRQARVEIAKRLAAAVQPSQAELTTFVELLGGEVTMRTSVMNFIGVQLGAAQVATLAAHPLVATIDINHPGTPELDNHKHSLGLVTGFWQNNINGGVHDVGVLDTGVEQSHPALSSHRFLSNMGVHDTGTHGTGMAGILASTDGTYTGMAYGCDTIVMALAGSIETSMPGMDYIASTGEPENTNYSFGNGTATDGDYMPTDQFFDGVIDTFGFMVSKSTGNGGWGVTTITHPAPAYNLMASANMEDYNTVPRSDDRITSSSSTGPTKGGRKKPDITAPGNNSMSCHPSGSFANIGGTSSASPHTGGGIVLLWDMGTTDVTAAKAILLNTTDAIDNKNTSSIADDEWVEGSHWNARYGWGYLNLGAAYLHGLDAFIDTVPDAPEDADFRLYVGQMFDKERATLTWRRHVAYKGATYPTQIEDLSDLDLFAYGETTGAELARSTSRIDNVEQLHVNEDALVVLKVEAFGTFDPEIDEQEFALATQENFAAASGPAFTVAFDMNECVTPNAEFDVAVTVTNSGDLAGHEVKLTLSGVTIVQGPNPASVGTLPAGDDAGAQWTVKAPAQPGNIVIRLDVASDAYGEQFTGLGEVAVKVATSCKGDMNCDGKLDFGDINPFVLALTDPNGYQQQYPDCELTNADINEDGKVDFADINPFVDLLVAP